MRLVKMGRPAYSLTRDAALASSDWAMLSRGAVDSGHMPR
jgi:hypothetical protein